MASSLDQLRRGPRLLDYFLIGVGAFIIMWGHAVGGWSPLHARGVDVVTVTSHGVSVTTRVRTVRRVVHGRVVHVEDKVYVLVPVIVVHTDHHTIRVPAHRLPIRSAAATVADPLVTVRVQVPTTVFVPTTVTTTVTQTDQLPPVTTTITLPLATSSPPPAD